MNRPNNDHREFLKALKAEGAFNSHFPRVEFYNDMSHVVEAPHCDECGDLVTNQNDPCSWEEDSPMYLPQNPFLYCASCTADILEGEEAN